MHKKIIYQPPPDTVIEACVRQICQNFAQTNEAFNQPDVIWGFTEFVKVVSAINARALNEAPPSNPERVDS